MLKILNSKGYNFEGYDPFSKYFNTKPSKKYQIITCFEVMEHTIDTLKLHKEIFSLLEENGIIIFSTLFQPNEIETLKTNWWYIAPRNGHFSFYTQNSLINLYKKINKNYTLLSLSSGFHIAYNVNFPPF